ncbi:UPF0691 protein C9orf116-like protein [Huso huso]|uniref:UPF0691 protein C9orf116-like protein n=1 Tax=Huso huso TaxID=61971 RepID=A0ABR0YEL4_HUSHU
MTELGLENTAATDPGANKESLTSDFYKVNHNLLRRFEHPDWFKAYREQPPHPLYRTTNQTYGSKKPTVHEMPINFFANSRQFSEYNGKCGMYRNNGFNTHIEKSFVNGSDNLITFQDRLNFHKSYNMSGPSHTG